MKVPTMTMIALLLACRPVDDEGASNGANSNSDGADGDPWNCGELGLECVGALGIGSCVEGACGPALVSECTASQTCESLCGSVGLICAERECEGATAFAFAGVSQAEADERCLEAKRADAVGVEIACSEMPVGESALTWLCCA